MTNQLDQPTFKAFQEFIYDKAGIHYPDEKLGLLSNRIQSRIRDLEVGGYRDYLGLIKTGRAADELQSFLNAITTNETYFFRCQKHWDFFRDWLREKKIEMQGQRHKQLSIWSAAASNGSEAYTIAICCKEILGDDLGGCRVEILGTDLNDEVLAEARAAVYRPYALSHAPNYVEGKYFKKVDDDAFKLDPKLASMVQFKPHNLQNRLSHGKFDLIFVRNVMIYFDIPSKENVLAQMRALLQPGGFLLVGESESLLNLEHKLTYVKPSIFMMPGPGIEIPDRLKKKKKPS